jgi:hypothetical protein
VAAHRDDAGTGATAPRLLGRERLPAGLQAVAVASGEGLQQEGVGEREHVAQVPAALPGDVEVRPERRDEPCPRRQASHASPLMP